ncbi:ATP-binding cassette domain-containing protein [Novosphingobium aerophilum]|uniref:ATP-binding cassette domain-containing protein n=1 Tax=Novosphingobium aerophilum TaxID=2839843 RepID=A0A7X1F861_9SPHN|nr:ATP-binding cassette domain-containing protein [Novosphingobium aerophilum]MBC2652014.1 ATP-binding cassette domain-containing protein [Novosphingobium aerophilum]
MVRMQSAEPGQQSLLGHLIDKARSRTGAARSDESVQVALNPLPMLDALVLLSSARGIETSVGQLSVALPAHEGNLSPRFAPLALSRVGLEAQWRPLGRKAPQQVDLPLLAPLADGGAVLITRVAADGEVMLRDAAGERIVDYAVLRRLLTGEGLHTGPLDPVNGATQSQQRDLVRRNPKLWLLAAYFGERKIMGRMLLAAALLNLCALSIPLYMRAIYDRVIPNLAIESLWALSAGVIVVLVFELLLKKLKNAFVDGVGLQVGQAVQHRAVHSVLRAREQSSSQSFGAMLTALRDVESLALIIPQAISTLLVDLPFTILFFCLIGAIGGYTVIGPVVGAIALLGFGAVANFALRLASRRTSKLVQARSDLIGEMTEGWSTIKANGAEGLFEGRWDVISDHLAVNNRQLRHWNELPASISGLIMQLVTVMVVVISVFQIKSGTMTTGALIAVVMLTSRAMVPIAATVAIIARLYQSGPQFSSLSSILQTEPEVDQTDPAISQGRIRGDIRAGRLNYTFKGASEPSLRDISFQIEPGEKIALIGKSGSGKSTLLRAIAGLLPDKEGLLTVDGHAIERFAVPHLRENIVFSAQDATIFDGSLWHNILLGMPEPSEDVVDRAIRCSGLDAFVARTVEGYMRKAGPRGAALSGGQRQSLLLARALIRDPAVLLLDEPTASLDVSSELHVINGLREAARDRTLIVATHRLALLELVDRVIWLDEGRIIADRPKAEVLAKLAGQAGGAQPNPSPNPRAAA